MRGYLRKSSYVLSLLMMIFFSLVVLSVGVKAEEICTRIENVQGISVYRAYLPSSGEHLYTTAQDEFENLINNFCWEDEGIAWYSPRTGAEVYRLYNANGTKEHLYTTNIQEVEILCATQGWELDNQGEAVFYSGGDIPVYRVYHPDLGIHHLTKDKNEYDTLTQFGWFGEGEAFRASKENSVIDYPMGPLTIENVPGTYAIEADVSAAGVGSGYHSKIGLLAPLSGISFGIQYDSAGTFGYTGVTSFLVENVMSNAPGQQEYVHVNLAEPQKTFRLMMALEDNGICHYYINGKEYGTVFNPNLVNKDVDPRLEGSARLNGDVIFANFSNIKVKKDGYYDPDRPWMPLVLDTNKGLHSDISKYDSEKRISISGILSGIGFGSDWDSEYSGVSGCVNFYKIDE